MDYTPKQVTFDHPGNWDVAILKLKTEGRVELASVVLSNPPTIRGRFVVVFEDYDLTPDHIPALANVNLVASLQFDRQAVSSAEAVSDVFRFRPVVVAAATNIRIE